MNSPERRTGLRAVIMETFAEAYAAPLRQRFPEVAFRTAAAPAEALPMLADAEVLLALAPFITAEMFAAAPRLEWVQALTTGVDNILAMAELRPEVLITNARGIHGPQMAEMAFLHMLALARDWRRMQASQAAAVWDRQPQRLLWRRTVAVIGMGSIAEDFARRAKAFDMGVIGVTERPRYAPGFDKVYARDEMAKALGQADFVLVLTPYSPATHHLIDAAALAAMRPDAYLINLARGGVVDEAALLAALDSGALAGAGLDVFATEPLPAGSPLWRHPKVLITPHVGGMSDVYEAQVLPIVEHNLEAFLSGRLDLLQNRVIR